ncbi:MAG: carbohydrate-binding family 9-like protein [Armatimonadota bacterium]
MRGILLFLLLAGGLAASGCRRRPAMAPTAPQPLPAPSAPEVPEYTCQRITGGVSVVDGSLADAGWRPIAWTSEFQRWDGEAARTRTRAKLAWDDQNLYVAFECQDRDLQGTMTARDDNLWEQDEVVELFADAGDDQQEYLEFEVNPRGALLDLIIPYRGRPRTLQGSKNWDSKGWCVGVETHGTIGNSLDVDGGWTCEMAIPLRDFLDAPNQPPEPGDVWRINLYRVDKDGTKVEFQAWSPTLTEEPNFHVPERFGRLVFAEASPMSKGSR